MPPLSPSRTFINLHLRYLRLHASHSILSQDWSNVPVTGTNFSCVRMRGMPKTETRTSEKREVTL